MMNTRERKAHMKEMYDSGKTMREIGEVFGISRERVRQILKEMGHTYRHFGAHVDSESAAAIVKFYNEGSSLLSSTKEFKRSPRAIRKVIDSLSQRREPSVARKFNSNRLPENLRQEVIQLYQSGFSSAKVSSQVGLSQSSVISILNQEGIMRDRKEAWKFRDGHSVNK